MRIALVHPTYEPQRGGVDLLMRDHAALFAENGHIVSIVCGRGESDQARVRTIIIPEMLWGHPLSQAVQKELDDGILPDEGADEKSGRNFFLLAKRFLIQALSQTLAEVDVVFVHGVLTTPRNLVTVAALWEIAERQSKTLFFSWVHETPSCSPGHSLPNARRVPWSLLCVRSPQFRYIASTDHLKRQFLAINDAPEDCCRVVPNGIDAFDGLNLTGPAGDFVQENNLLARDFVLLHPAAIVPRSQIECGLRLAAALKACGQTCAYLVTGPPDLSSNSASGYGHQMRQLRDELRVGHEVFFVHDYFEVNRADLIQFHRVADFLFCPEGLENRRLIALDAALHRLPILCAEAESAVTESAGRFVSFDPRADLDLAATRLMDFASQSPALRSRKSAVRNHSWAAIYRDHIAPLLTLPTL